MENPSSSTKKQGINENGAFDQVAQPSAFANAPSSSTAFEQVAPSSVGSIHFNSMENPSSSTKKQGINENGTFDQVAQPSAFANAPSSSTAFDQVAPSSASAYRVRAMRRARVAGPTIAFGLEERVENIEEILHGVESESVHIVGIVGTGGCGKTTLAQEFFKSKLSSFSRCSFLYDVRDSASKNQLCGLQKRLLKDLRVQCSQFESIEEGKEHLAHYLRSLRALIVLDNVDCTEQIDSLLPAKQRLGLGSVIVLTTRDAEVLTSWGISGRFIYRMTGLSRSHAKKLFCSHAFQNPDAPDGFEDLVERAIKSCQGLPLSLKVFGQQLYSKPRDYWESQLNEMSRVLPVDILSRLKISYDALDQEEQDVFLDVACFFIGKAKSLVLQLWNGLGRSGVYCWETLQNKCLVEVDQQDRIRMHDHLRDLGRKIAYKMYREVSNEAARRLDHVSITMGASVDSSAQSSWDYIRGLTDTVSAFNWGVIVLTLGSYGLVLSTRCFGSAGVYLSQRLSFFT